MKRSKILMDFLRLGDGALAQKAMLVRTSMTGNAYFPSAASTLDELEACIQAYQLALAAAANLDRGKVAQKNISREKLEALMIKLANHVTAVADGDEPTLLSSGFTISNGVKAAGVALGSIQNFTVERGDASGEVKVGLDTVLNARSYLFYYAIAGVEPLVWQSVASSTTSNVITDLQVGKNYSFYVKAVGTKNKTTRCDMVTKMVS